MQQWERDYAPLTFIPVVQEPERLDRQDRAGAQGHHG
jgi:hypothetical protein